MQDNKSKARVKRCKGWLEQLMMRVEEHLANPSDISVRKPLLFLSLVFYHHLEAFSLLNLRSEHFIMVFNTMYF